MFLSNWGKTIYEFAFEVHLTDSTRVFFFQVKNKTCLGCSKNYVNKMRWVGAQKKSTFDQVQGKKFPY